MIMLSSLGTLFDSIKSGHQGPAKGISDDQNSDRDIFLDDTLKMNRKEINDALEGNSSKYDKFFDDGDTSTNLLQAFDSFAEVVMLDDDTEVDFDQLDDELSATEYYDSR